MTANHATAVRCAVSAATALLAAGAASPALAQEQSPDIIEIHPCDDRCGLVASVVGAFGDNDGPGMIESEYSIGFFDRSGRMYVISYDHVQVFAADGSFLSRVGRRGEGPGEMLDLGSLAVVEDGVFVVLDRGRGVLMKFDWTGKLLHETRLMGWAPDGVGTIPIGEGLAVHRGNIRTPERIGYPLHVINLESGEIETSFGSLTGEYDPAEERRLDVVVAGGPGQSIWMARLHAYWIELWEPDNRLVLSIKRQLDWFPDALEDLEHRGHGGENREPEPALVSIAADDSLLWVMMHRADEDWANAPRDDESRQIDTVIEAIDWKRGRVIATQRFDEAYYPLLGPGLVGQVVITPQGSMRFTVLRMEPEAG